LNLKTKKAKAKRRQIFFGAAAVAAFAQKQGCLRKYLCQIQHFGVF